MSGTVIHTSTVELDTSHVIDPKDNVGESLCVLGFGLCIMLLLLRLIKGPTRPRRLLP